MSHYYDQKVTVESKPQSYNVIIKDTKLSFKTDSGVFSKGFLDFGTYVLLNTFTLPELAGPILDMCSGYGPVGVYLAKTTDRDIYMSEINERAYGLGNENLKLNNAKALTFCGNLYEALPINIEFAGILVNPPIRAGKETVFAIYDGAYERLLLGGNLWVVIQKKQGAESSVKHLNALFGNATVVNKEKGYWIIKCLKEA